MNPADASLEGRSIIVSRVFEAPVALVWKAWTTPSLIAKWWGPIGFTTEIEVMDVRPGGLWNHVMVGPDGTRFPNFIRFTEVVPHERICFENGGHQEGGPSVSFLATWTFEAIEIPKTKVTIHLLFPSAAERDRVARDFGAVEGAHQTLARLDEQLGELQPDEREITVTRIIDAPRDLVFRFWTEPALLSRWWGPSGFTIPLCEVDLRVGGAYRIVMRGPDNQDYPCVGVYREITPPERLVFTNNAEGADGSEVLTGLAQVSFQAVGDKTRLIVQTRARAMVPFARAYLTGMEAGWTQSIDRLQSALGSR